MKKILPFFILITILTFNNVFSQATPYVDVIPPVAVCNSGDCVDLLADYLETEITNTYRVESIPYLPPASFTPLSDSFVFDSSQDDRWSSTFTLPFDFCFYGQYYNQVLVGSNGLITFDISGIVPGGSENPGGYCEWSYNESITDPNFPIKSSICGVYQDTNINQPPVLNPAVQNVNYRIFGTAPTRKFIVSYNELPQYSCNDGVGRQTSQIVIYETSNVIEVYVARRTPCLGWNGGRGVIGIINSDGSLNSHPANRDTGTWTATNEAWRFVPDGGVINSQISWLANGTLIPGSVGQNPINVCPTVNTDYTAVISYTECDATIKRISETITIGPEIFPLIEPQDITICTSGPPPYTFDIDQGNYIEGGTQSGNYGYSYYNSQSDAQNFISPIDPTTLNTYQSNGGETIWVAVEDYIGGCVFIRSFDLLAIASPSGDITYSSPNYCSNDSNLYTPTNTAPSGGQYIVTPATGLSIDTSTGEINPSLSTEGSYSIVYHLDATATCPAYDTPPFDLDIINCDCSLVLTSAVNTDNQVICISDAITPIEYTVGGVATGANVTGLPTGVSAVFSGGVVTISGTPTVTGTYNYNVETVGCSSNLILSGSITISPAPTLTSVTGNGPICEGEDAIFTIVGTPNATVSYSLDSGTTTQT
ncbi:hypothetical protein GOQ30_17015, partial [Flavobacterium sp. TP390]|nr:hypothetical protein [Flavobacterium profundi]